MHLLNLYSPVMLLIICVLANVFPVSMSPNQISEVGTTESSNRMSRSSLLTPSAIATGTWALVSPPPAGSVLTTSVPTPVDAGGVVTVTVMVTTNVPLTPFMAPGELSSQWKVLGTSPGISAEVLASVIGTHSALITATIPLTKTETVVTFDLVGTDLSSTVNSIDVRPEPFRINRECQVNEICRAFFLPLLLKNYRNPCNNSVEDWCEPNNTIATAFEGLSFNQTIEAKVNLDSDQRDHYKFNLTDIQPYTFMIGSSNTSADLDIYLYDAATSQLLCKSHTANTNVEKIVFKANQPPCNAPAGKVYDLMVYVFTTTLPSANISYTLQVQH